MKIIKFASNIIYSFVMYQLNLPSYKFKIELRNEKPYIFDKLRKKYVALTPEEWVRQNFIRYLTEEKSFPCGRIGNEVSLNLNGMRKRSDSVVYNDFGLPIVIIEYKAPNVAISQHVFDQITRYNIVMKVDFLIVSNGMRHFCCKINYDTNSYFFLEELPDYQTLKQACK